MMNEELPAPTANPFRPPGFNVDDESGYKYLEEHGYVVFKNVLNNEELNKGKSLAWDFLEGLPNAGIKRNDYKTWNHNWPDIYNKGILVEDAVGQSEFLWFVRSNENVQKVYRKIWETDELATSFDGFGIHRPFEYNKNWITTGGWYHLDQNGGDKPNKICIQGLVNFYDSGEDDGGLIVVPDSVKIFKDIFKTRTYKGDFVMLHKNDEKGIWRNEAKHLQPIKIVADAGDMLLWDSRTIHCNTPARTSRKLPTDGSQLEPRRLVAYVCMIPMNRLNKTIKEKRVQGYLQGATTTHWPEECEIGGRINTRFYTPLPLSDRQKALIPL
eukprot:TRINITY_DN1831_c0_g1_i1.p1 TRINITY_DN1831_c0_g1~~TRINITY_DN1831_c0_g1_i1.p1  ORF type:complete len:327 (-),score=68.06 TRINITY_DN1831_c0_g1_i1:76-1056(-)